MGTLRLHTTHSPEDLDQSMVIAPEHQSAFIKPHGLWFAHDLSWHRWASSEMPEMIGPHWHVLKVRPEHLLQVRTPEQVLDAQKKYGNERGTSLNWEKVARDFAGFDTGPRYNKFHPGFGRRPPLWYSSLDVPSGVIWDGPRGLVGTRRIPFDRIRAIIKARGTHRG